VVSWSRDGRFFYIYARKGQSGATYSIPLRPGQLLPTLPDSGLASLADAAALPGARVISESRAFPGPDPSRFAFARVTVHRNIYRISVP
jgi:hypothetical protein